MALGNEYGEIPQRNQVQVQYTKVQNGLEMKTASLPTVKEQETQKSRCFFSALHTVQEAP